MEVIHFFVVGLLSFIYHCTIKIVEVSRRHQQKKFLGEKINA